MRRIMTGVRGGGGDFLLNTGHLTERRIRGKTKKSTVYYTLSLSKE